jgi:hypothetical protein
VHESARGYAGGEGTEAAVRIQAHSEIDDSRREIHAVYRELRVKIGGDRKLADVARVVVRRLHDEDFASRNHQGRIGFVAGLRRFQQLLERAGAFLQADGPRSTGSAHYQLHWIDHRFSGRVDIKSNIERRESVHPHYLPGGDRDCARIRRGSSGQRPQRQSVDERRYCRFEAGDISAGVENCDDAHRREEGEASFHADYETDGRLEGLLVDNTP